MRMYDIILKKRQGHPLSKEEIAFFVQGYTDGSIPDYQASALLMAIFFQDMTMEETTALTIEMAKSGDMVDLSSIEGIKVDKHSTGGVGDKTTLVLAPVVASLGVKVAKMSGRGLGHTGGTVDKLESIPGFRTELSMEEFFDIVNRIGISVIGQSGNITPADKKIYALRDVTATVDKLPLIASSIVSKKLAAGSDAIVLDVKCGSGAFMKTMDDAIELARAMVEIAENAGRRCVALITSMDVPLGERIGNALEVIEALEVLRGAGPEDLRHECIVLASEMLSLAGKGTLQECAVLVREVLDSGSAFETFVQMVELQGGDTRVLHDLQLFAQAAHTHEVKAAQAGYIHHMDTEQCGIASLVLGAGRRTKEESIDPAAGIRILKKTGDFVQAGETMAILYTNRPEMLAEADRIYREAMHLTEEAPAERKQILARVARDEIIRY